MPFLGGSPGSRRASSATFGHANKQQTYDIDRTIREVLQLVRQAQAKVTAPCAPVKRKARAAGWLRLCRLCDVTCL